MITCNILGPGAANSGLGNQMFCIASTLGLAYENDDDATFPELNVPPFDFYGRTIFHKLNKMPANQSVATYHEPAYTSTIYNKIPYQEDICIRGHFQSYRYFHEHEKKIKGAFQLPHHISSKIDKKYEPMLGKSSDLVSIHVRRGDYLLLSGHYVMLGEDYYREALGAQENREVVIFSDDIEWCKENLLFSGMKIHFIEGETDIIDMYLMSKVKNNIIANSTFSWWAAYLNDNEHKKVIAPKKWFGPKRPKNKSEIRDLYPESWVKV